MSLNIYADIREIFAELSIQLPQGQSVFIRVPNRKDQMLTGLRDALELSKEHITPEQALQSQVTIRSDYADTLLREHWLDSIGVVCTEGFQNILEFSDHTRKDNFSLTSSKDQPLILKEHCFGISERINAKGEILKSLQIEEIDSLKEKLKLLNTTDVAVCFLHSNKNPEHEILFKNTLQKHSFNVYLSHEQPGSEFSRLENTIKNIVQIKAYEETKKVFIEYGFKHDQIKNAAYSNKEITVFENKILVGNSQLPLSPLSAVTVDSSGVPLIMYKNVQAEPGPVAFGKGVEITCLDILFYKHKLKYADSLKRIKVDHARIKKYLTLLAQQMRTDLDSAVERYLFLLHELLKIEIQDYLHPETIVQGELAGYIFPTLKNRIKTKAYVTQTGELQS